MYCEKWINIKKTFACFYKNGNMQCLSLKNMIRDIGREFQGRAHSGIDDVRNIASIVQRLLTVGACVTFNEKLVVNRAKKSKIRPNFTSADSSTQVKIRNLKVLTAKKKAKIKNPAKKIIPAMKVSTKDDVKDDQIKSKKNRKRKAKRRNKKTQVHAKGLKTADNLTNTKQILRNKLKRAAKRVRTLKKRLESALHQEALCSPI